MINTFFMEGQDVEAVDMGDGSFMLYSNGNTLGYVRCAGEFIIGEDQSMELITIAPRSQADEQEIARVVAGTTI